MTGWGAQPALDEAYGLGVDALNKLRAAAAEQGVTLPDRQVVYFFPVPMDCDQVTVSIEALAPTGLPDDGQMVECRSFAWECRMYLAITRETCAVMSENGDYPEPSLMQEALRVASDDAKVLQGVVARYDRVAQTEISFEAPNGKYQEVTMLLTVPADGTVI